MSAVFGFALFMLWLGLGGYAHGKYPGDAKTTQEQLAWSFILCLILGPAIFGFGLATKWGKK